MNFRRFLDAAEALLVEAYSSMPHSDLMTAIRDASEWRVAGRWDEQPQQVAPASNDASLAEFQQMTRGLKHA